MTAYVLRRLIMTIPTLFLVSILVFGMIRLIPGDALTVMLGETLVNMPQADLDKLKAE